jgi:hypothetical protein
MLEKDKIGIIPEIGYFNPANNKKALEWLQYFLGKSKYYHKDAF